MRAISVAVPVLMAVLALSGCSDSGTYRVGDAEARAMQPPPSEVKRVADAGFCSDVAHQAVDAGFDDASRAHLYNVNYRQCLAVFGPPAMRLALSGGGDSGY